MIFAFFRELGVAGFHAITFLRHGIGAWGSGCALLVAMSCLALPYLAYIVVFHCDTYFNQIPPFGFGLSLITGFRNDPCQCLV